MVEPPLRICGTLRKVQSIGYDSSCEGPLHLSRHHTTLAQVGAVQKFSEPAVVDGFLQRVLAAVGKPAGASFSIVRPQ